MGGNLFNFESYNISIPATKGAHLFSFLRAIKEKHINKRVRLFSVYYFLSKNELSDFAAGKKHICKKFH